MLSEKEVLLIERERIIAEKETQLAERDRVIAVRDAELYAKTLQIEQLKAQLAVLRSSCAALSIAPVSHAGKRTHGWLNQFDAFLGAINWDKRPNRFQPQQVSVPLG